MEENERNGAVGSIKQKLTKCCCSCFGLKPSGTAGNSKHSSKHGITSGSAAMNMKPQGLFGCKSFNEVCLEIAENDNYGGLPDRQSFGLISCIVKSGDDLK